MTARFGLPPGIDDGAAVAADVFAVPHPCLWVDGLADGAEHLQARQVVLCGVLVAPLHECADGRGCGVELRDPVSFDDLPEAVGGGVVGRALVHERGDAVGQDTVDDV